MEHFLITLGAFGGKSSRLAVLCMEESEAARGVDLRRGGGLGGRGTLLLQIIILLYLTLTGQGLFARLDFTLQRVKPHTLTKTKSIMLERVSKIPASGVAALRNITRPGIRRLSHQVGSQPPRGWVPTPYITETIVRLTSYMYAGNTVLIS